jgi:ABC-type transporter Mla maintaining outer membrane lipid asymmetry ATPase subunit MlaF
VVVTAAPLIEILAVSKHYGEAQPLRVAQLHVAAGDRIAIAGFDAGAAETFMHLVTGAALPDRGEVRIDGRATTEIATDTEWLRSLDRFGIVTERSVLFEGLPVAASLALPLSLSIDPMPPAIRRQVDALAAMADLEPQRLDVPASALSPPERVRVHLARAIAHQPAFVLLERPTDRLAAAADRRAFGSTLRRASEARQFGWLAITDDDDFVTAAGGQRLALSGATGALTGRARWTWPWARRR